jgi:hypothetical protein
MGKQESNRKRWGRTRREKLKTNIVRIKSAGYDLKKAAFSCISKRMIARTQDKIAFF